VRLRAALRDGSSYSLRFSLAPRHDAGPIRRCSHHGNRSGVRRLAEGRAEQAPDSPTASARRSCFRACIGSTPSSWQKSPIFREKA